MDQDIFIKEDQPDPLNIQGNEIIPSENNDKIDPMSDCIAQINNYKGKVEKCPLLNIVPPESSKIVPS